MNASSARPHPLTIALHWGVALLMIGLTGTGLYMATWEVWALYPWHKSFGVLAVLLVVLRLLGRWWKPFSPAPTRASRPAQAAAHGVHQLLLGLTLLMPVSGLLSSGLGGYGIKLFDWELLSKNFAPGSTEQLVPHHAALADFAHLSHEYLGYLLALTIVLHIAGALKHHLLDRDTVLLRMLGRG